MHSQSSDGRRLASQPEIVRHESHQIHRFDLVHVFFDPTSLSKDVIPCRREARERAARRTARSPRHQEQVKIFARGCQGLRCNLRRDVAANPVRRLVGGQGGRPARGADSHDVLGCRHVDGGFFVWGWGLCDGVVYCLPSFRASK